MSALYNLFRPVLLAAVGCCVVALAACGHYLIPGPFQPLEATQQQDMGEGQRMEVFDDGTVTFFQNRLEVSVRPMSDIELNRQFASFSEDGGGPADELPTNVFTYGNWQDKAKGGPPQRFSIIRITVKNYEYPKVKFDPLTTTVTTANGRVYYPWGKYDFIEYFRRFPLAFNGLGYQRFTERRDMLNRSQYPENEFCFSGQEVDGFVIFPKFHDDVEEITFRIPDFGFRYDFREEPLEAIDLSFSFKRDLLKVKSYDEVAGQ